MRFALLALFILSACSSPVATEEPDRPKQKRTENRFTECSDPYHDENGFYVADCDTTERLPPLQW